MKRTGNHSSDRHRVGEFGAPFWSPDGLGFLINSLSEPTTCTVVNLQTRDGGAVQVAGHSILSWPSWAGPGTLLSSLSSDNEADSIVLLAGSPSRPTAVISSLTQTGPSDNERLFAIPA